MPSRIVIKYKIPDARGLVAQKHFASLGFRNQIKSVAIADSYFIDSRFGASELEKIGTAFTNPLIEDFSINTINPPKVFDWAIEIGFLPGVTDNVGFTAQETIADLLKKKFQEQEKVYSSQ